MLNYLKLPEDNTANRIPGNFKGGRGAGGVGFHIKETGPSQKLGLNTPNIKGTTKASLVDLLRLNTFF